MSPKEPQAHFPAVDAEDTRIHATRSRRPEREEEPENPWAFWRSLVLTLAVALGIRQFLVEARYIPSGSMLPGLQLQDRLLVEKLSYRGRVPQRGEIIVFHAPHHLIRC